MHHPSSCLVVIPAADSRRGEVALWAAGTTAREIELRHGVRVRRLETAYVANRAAPCARALCLENRPYEDEGLDHEVALELQTRPVDGRRVDPAEVVDLLYDLGHGAVLVGTDGVVALPRMEGLLAADVALGMTGIMGFDTTVRHLNVILPGPVARRLLVSHLAGFEFMPGAPLYAPPVSSPLVSATSWDVGQRDCGDVELRVSFGALCPGVHVALAVLDCAIIRAEVAGDLSDQELSSLVGHLIRRSPL